MKVPVDFLRRFPTFGRFNLAMTLRTGAAVQLLIDHPQIGIDVALRSDRRARIFIFHRLGDHNRRTGAADFPDFGFRYSLHAHSFQILPLTFIKQHVDQKCRFPGAGHPGQDDQLFFRQRQ